MLLLGCDFSSAPTRRKPIVMALGRRGDHHTAVLSSFEHFTSLDAWGDWMRSAPEWIGGFDFPFGLPRELVTHLGWPLTWDALIAHYASLERAEIRQVFAAFCAARPAGAKFAHRATDGPAGSSPSMKWVNPPVALMMHAGVPRLLAAGATLPGLHVPDGPGRRVALEAYPGMLARELIGRRSYKSDDPAASTAERKAARADILAALESGASRLGSRLVLGAREREQLLDDVKGDRIDAVLCLVQAAWAARHASSPGPGFGLPADMDPIEGWIVTA